jgi:hypothetical protein
MIASLAISVFSLRSQKPYIKTMLPTTTTGAKVIMEYQSGGQAMPPAWDDG